MMADDRGWYWRNSARRNLEFHAALGPDARAARERAVELLEAFGLAEHADRRVGTYSSGMRARLGLVRAMATQPPVLLLDEPSGRLDPAAALELRESIRALADDGVGILLATHDLREAAAVADQVVVLSAGRVAYRAGSGVTVAELEAQLLDAA
jgi:ABC-2 type transport system ATP-binding protein